MNINPFIDFISFFISFYIWLVIIWIIMGWLSYFRIINDYNPFIRKVNEILHRLINPLIRPLRNFTRRIIGDLGGIDISPIILFALLYLLRNILYTYFYTF